MSSRKHLWIVLCLLLVTHCSQKSPTEATPKGDESLIAFYPFNKNADDSSGNGNNGVVYGATPAQDRFGHDSSAFFFNGLTDSIICGNADTLNFYSNDFTLSFWLKTPFGNDLIVVGKADGEIRSTGSLINGWNVQIENDQADGWGVRLDMSDSAHGGVNIVNAKEAVDDQWHLVSITANRSGNAIIYVDTTKIMEKAISTIGSIRNSAPLRIGKRADWPAGAYEGYLDDLRIYNRAIALSEIITIYKENGWAEK